MEIATLFESSEGTPESGTYEPGVAARGQGDTYNPPLFFFIKI